MKGIEQENNYYFVDQTSLSVLKVKDCLDNGLSFDDIQQLFRLTHQQVIDTKSFLEKYTTELEVQYRNDIEKFKNDMLTKLEGTHTHSWKQRSTGFSTLALGVFIFYGATLTFHDPTSRILLIPLACLFVFGGMFLIYVQSRSMYTFQSYALSVRNGLPPRNITLYYDNIQRIKISPYSLHERFLYIQSTSSEWIAIICTDSISKGIEEIIDYGQYDPVLHFELPEEQSLKAKRS